MPNIFETFFQLNYAFDQVAIFDQNFNQVFQKARPLKVVVKRPSKSMEHPTETGTVITDHRVLLPIELELSLILNSDDYADVYKTIERYYINGTLLYVQTKARTFENQYIYDLPHEENPEQYDALIVSLPLKQFQIVSTSVAVVTNQPQHTSTVSRGVQEATILPQNTYAQQIFKSVGLD